MFPLSLRPNLLGGTALTLLTLVGSLGASASVEAQTTVPPQVTIDSISSKGSACPQGTTTVNVSEDKKALTVLFAEYAMEIGAAAKSHYAYKSCDVSIKLKAPAGWSYAPYTFDYRGFSSLAAKTYVLFQTFYYFGGVYRWYDQMTKKGAVDADFTHRVNVKGGYLWSPCNSKPRELLIRTRAYLYGREGTFGLDSLDGEIGQSQTIGLQWRRCS